MLNTKNWRMSLMTRRWICCTMPPRKKTQGSFIHSTIDSSHSMLWAYILYLTRNSSLVNVMSIALEIHSITYSSHSTTCGCWNKWATFTRNFETNQFWMRQKNAHYNTHHHLQRDYSEPNCHSIWSFHVRCYGSRMSILNLFYFVYLHILLTLTTEK